MKTHMTPREWLEFPKETREWLRQTFSIAKSGPIELENGKMVSDGSTAFDLMKLNLGALIAFLGPKSGIDTDGLFERLLAQVIEKPVDTEEVSKTVPAVEAIQPEAPVENVKPCCGSRGARHKANCATLTA